MKRMLEVFFAAHRIQFTVNVNWLIYYFKKIPLLGGILPDSIYSVGGLKTAVSAVVSVIMVFKRFLTKSLYIGLTILLPVMMLFSKVPQEMRPESFIYLFFFLSFLAGTVQISGLLQTNRNRYVCIKLMRFPAKEFAISAMLAKHLSDFIYFLPVVLICFWIAGGTLLQGLLLTVLLLAFRFVCEGIQLICFHRFGFLVPKKYWFQWLIIVPSCVLAYVPPAFGMVFPLGDFLLSVPSAVILFVAAAFSLWYILRYKHFSADINASVPLEEIMLDMENYKNQVRFKDVKVNEAEFSKESLNSGKFEKKEGYEYLNAIFFDRHRKLLEKPIAVRLAIIGSVFVILSAAVLFVPEFGAFLSGRLMQILPILVFIMFFTSIGDRVCRAMFANCDVSLLRYGFYRRRDVILKNFKVRLRKVTALNMITAAAICAAVISLFLIAGASMELLEIVLFVVSVFCLAVFFSVHHLFLYYVFQPYTTELAMKNPFFQVLNIFVYMVSYMCLQLRNVPGFFTMTVIVATVVYIMLALSLVNRLAPKNFKVK